MAFRRHKKRQKKKHRAAPGSAPGTLVDRSGESSTTVVTRLSYNEGQWDESILEHPLHTESLTENDRVVWIDIEGFGDLEIIRHFGELGKLHRLSIEDIVTYQRPKVDLHGETALLTLKAFTDCGEEEQLTLVLGPGFLMSFQEGVPGDCFNPLRKRIKENVGIVRSRGADYLTYALIDAIIDSFFPIVDKQGDFLEKLEDEVLGLERQGSELVDDIRRARRDLSSLHRNLRPLLDCLSALIRDSQTFKEESRIYLNDCRDHVLQLLDSLEGQRELVVQLTDLYLSSLSNRMNQIMSVLTVIATIFMPLSFIAGVYGMNFNPEISPFNMPELNWRFGYPFALTLMATVAIGMLVFFRNRGWFQSQA
jgi:magnesium transporter